MTIMPRPYATEEIAALVEPDRVHRNVYIDPALFQLELERLWGRAWIYVGHESQVPNTGDYFATEIARQPVIMVRHSDGTIRVLHNRCAHKGAEVVTERTGNVRFFFCNYHGWTYKTDGSLLSVPLKKGYEGTCFSSDDPAFGLPAVARVDSYRGFVFASLAKEGPGLEAFLGGAKEGFDDLIERSPIDQVEVVGTCARTVQHANWKFFFENQLDVVHAGIVHISSVDAAKAVASKAFKEGEPQPLALVMLQAQQPPDPGSIWETLDSFNFPYGHSNFRGYMPSRPPDPDQQAYEAAMREKLGEAETERRLNRNFHHTILYPCLSIQSTFGQIRVIKPLAVDRTLMEIWHFRPKGVPQGFLSKGLTYSNVVNSPATIVSCDDYETWWRCQQGLACSGNDWISVHRDVGRDIVEAGVTKSNTGSSEVFQRHQYAAWSGYMTGRI